MDALAFVVHALPRRAHLRSPPLVDNRRAAERIAAALAREGTFDRVTVRPSTGSIIVEGPEGTVHAPELAARVKELVLAEQDDAGAPLVPPPLDRLPGPTRVARAVAHAAFGINGDVRVALDHRADLGTLLPVVFAAAGLAEVAVTGRVPVPTWFNLLWWSMRSFMTFNVDALAAESCADPRAEGADP